MSELDARLDEIAHTPVLLVASDFDGTIAPIVADPEQAEADREAVVALKALAGMPQTHVAIVSGRALADLGRRAALVEDAHLVGSHGSEFEAGFALPIPAEGEATLRFLWREAEELARTTPGCICERKPAGLAFHYRNAEASAAARAVQDLLDRVAQNPEVHVIHGKKVVELSVVKTDKGRALRRLRQRLGASAVLFVGDDVTDEDAFTTLSGPDIGIKVGGGSTLAQHRLSQTTDVARAFARVAERRADWLAGSAAIPIELHGFLSDQRTVALIAPDGRVVWLCLPRLDSGAVFASLLGGTSAGYFEASPADGARLGRQSYVGNTLILKTSWPSLTITDYLDCGGGRAFQRAGRTDLVRVLSGRGAVRVVFAPRLDFGRVETHLHVCDAGIIVEGAVDPFVLRAPGLKWEVVNDGRHQSATATLQLNGGAFVLELRYGTASLAEDLVPEAIRRERTLAHWEDWATNLCLPTCAAQAALRSALVLRGLVYGPTGAMAAAATTSLPEHAGGVRNWDYRFCWPRDAAVAASALVRLNVTGPAMKLLDWLLDIVEKSPPPAMLRPVYSLTGRHLGPEAEIMELPGYRGSRPVRLGNAAAQQIQMDIFGPIANLIALLADRGAPLSADHWRMLDMMVETVGQHWMDLDHGIWEVRRARRHHVHSKVMCWQAVDRALQVGNYLGKHRPEWAGLRAAIAEDVLAKGYNSEVQAFGVAYAERDADAAALCTGLSGLLSPTDPRFVGTIRHVEQALREDSTVYRYRYDDGLPGLEGGFHLCTTWLIEAYALTGREAEARLLLDRVCAAAGPTGLLSEEFDPTTGTGLGNYPQAYSHAGLIHAALRLQEAEAGRRR